jgi:hypothetical protein
MFENSLRICERLLWYNIITEKIYIYSFQFPGLASKTKLFIIITDRNDVLQAVLKSGCQLSMM